MDVLISAADANRGFSRVLQDVRAGRSFVVTSHGKPVARIVPFTDADDARALARATLLERLASQPVTDIGEWSREDLYRR